jgi:ribonuclease HI
VFEYNDANKQDNVVQVCSRERNSSHIPPLLFSMNIDAGCFDNAQTGWGLVLKDNIGTVIFSACRREQVEVSPILAEALGLRWAIQIAISQGIQSVSIVCDALGVVNCVNGKCTVAVINHVIQDCRNLLKSIPFVMVSHVSRELNREAHVLASMAKSVGCRSWLGNVPSNLNSFPVPAMFVGQDQAICFN